MKKSLVYLSSLAVGMTLMLGAIPAHANKMHKTTTAASALTATNDTKITSVLKSKIVYAATKNEFDGKTDVSVTTNYGVVTLEGCVTTQKDEDRVKELADDTTDVVGVVNHLKVDAKCGS